MPSELRETLTRALASLLTRDEATRPFLIIEHRPSGQFVQFRGSASLPLLFDVPALKIQRPLEPGEDAAVLALRTLWAMLPDHLLHAKDIVLTDERSPENNTLERETRMVEKQALNTPLSPWTPCRCGGNYQLGHEHGSAILMHTAPFCERFLAVDSSEAAVRFSEENRRSGKN